MRPRSFNLPDLSGLDAPLTANYVLSITFGARAFPPGRAQHLVTGLVRCTEGALRCYEQARRRLERSAELDSFTEYLRGTDELELTFMALQRTMRLADGLRASPQTSVGNGDVPSQADRDLLRLVRNAIDHADGQVEHAGRGHAIRLDVQRDDSTIGDGSQLLTVSHARLAGWLRTLHELSVAVTTRPQDWIRP
jgi:hypothetical protein